MLRNHKLVSVKLPSCTRRKWARKDVKLLITYSISAPYVAMGIMDKNILQVGEPIGATKNMEKKIP